MWFVLAPVLATLHFTGAVPVAGGDYADVTFDVPAGTQEIRIAHDDGSSFDILDWGVWSPDGFRGWGGGLTDDAVIGVDQSSRGYLPGPITPGTWTLVIGKAKIGAAGGHYTVDVTLSDTQTLPVLDKAPFTPVVVAPARRWYRGDFHVHSSESGDASATFDEIVALAKQRGLDFVNLSDHNTISQHAREAAYLVAHPDFLLLRGAEITTYAGHGNAVGLSAYVDHRIGYQGRTIGGVLDDVLAQHAVFIVNHPKLDLGQACIGCAWAHADTDWSKVAGIEIITGNWDISVNSFVPQAMAMWDGLLDQGARIAAIGGSDDHTAGHSTGPTDSAVGSPTTRVLADNLSEAAIVDAIRHGRTSVQLRGPDDPIVDVTMQTATGAAAEIGDQVDGIARVKLAVHVTGGAGTLAQVWRNGVKLEPQQPVASADATLAFEDVPGAGAFRYRVELIDDTNHRLVVTSHFWVTAIAEPAPGSDAGPGPGPGPGPGAGDDAGGCGCGTGRGGLAGGAAPVLALLLIRRRRASS
ncbi:MAG: CehA/McbA family metallohydrolase [Kofleriaceae bacterium]